MNKSDVEFKDVYKTDLSILLCASILGVVCFQEDAFDRIHEYTRAHENWEMDEFLMALVSLLIGSVIISIRHVFLLKKANSMIRQFQKEKVNAEKMTALGEISSGLAHEINNALQPAIGLSDIIKKRLTDPQAVEYMDLIAKSSLHAKKIVEDILLFSRGQNSGHEIVDARDVFGSSAEAMRHTLPSSVKLHVTGTEKDKYEHLPVSVNRTSIHQIMSNLIQNAAHAMDGGEGNIWISIEERLTLKCVDLPRGRYVCVEVRDDGSGIDEKTLPFIFEPFFSTKEEGEGTGLGLSVIYGIMKSLGGKISAESKTGKGTVFTLYLPLQEVKAHE